MGSFVSGLDGDDASVLDRTPEFVNRTGIDLAVANIIQPHPGTGTFQDAVAGRYDNFLREACGLSGIIRCPRREGNDPGGPAVHLTRDDVVNRYGIVKTAHALRKKKTAPVIAEASHDGVASAELHAASSRTGEML